MEEITGLEDILKSEFFAEIKRFCGAIVRKYWLTGVLPAFRDGISPLTATRIISFDERYKSLCGFTQEDVNAILTRALPENQRASVLDSLKHWYNGYTFSPIPSGSEKSTLYNPQQVFIHLGNVISGSSLSCIDEANAVHTKTVLSVVGETGDVLIHDLVRTLSSKASASIMSKLSFFELTQELEDWSKDVTWSLLYYLGIMTFCEDSERQEVGTHNLYAPNGNMTHLVSFGMFVLRMVLIIDLILADSTTHQKLFQD
jgi:hypothetical protein